MKDDDQMEKTYIPSEKAVKIVEKIKEMTAKPVIMMDRKPDTILPSLTDSKFGGVPYWDMNMDYPTDSYGHKMILLVQINCMDLQEFDTDLPREGILQFFIGGAEDEVFGIDFDNPTSQKDFRVVFHDDVCPQITQEQVRALGIITAEECDDYSTPVFKQAALSFHRDTDYMNPDVAEFSGIFVQAVQAVTGEEIDKETWYRYLDGEDVSYLYDALSGMAHKMFGYPAFTQADPREGRADAQYFDTVLIQIDSDMQDGEDYVLWGDCGIANLFINQDALKKKDFSNVLYHWDCC